MGSTSYEIDGATTGRQEVLNYARQSLDSRATLLDYAYGVGDGRGSSSWGWGGVLYALVESEWEGVPHTEVIFYLYSVHKLNGYREFVVKVLSESMGSGRYDCPKRFLSRLTPTTDESALEWREGVTRFHERRRAARKLVGKTVVFANAIPYGGIGKVSTVRVESLTSWRTVDGSRYRLRPPTHWWMRSYRIA